MSDNNPFSLLVNDNKPQVKKLKNPVKKTLSPKSKRRLKRNEMNNFNEYDFTRVDKSLRKENREKNTFKKKEHDKTNVTNKYNDIVEIDEYPTLSSKTIQTDFISPKFSYCDALKYDNSQNNNMNEPISLLNNHNSNK